jgi:3',5'-cyclic AMP phosphodiesterase CpdA
MNNAILHISDLHFVLKAYKSKNRFDDNFQNKFLESIENKGIKYLVITGDIADTSAEKEYKQALIFLTSIEKRLCLDKKNIILCPGNHDVSWPELNKLVSEESVTDLTKIYENQAEKFTHFSKFYSDFYNNEKKFNENLAILDRLIDDSDKIILLAVNTCFRESNQENDHIGFINQKKFEQELSSIDFQNKYKDYGKILIMHHNPKDLSTEKKHNLVNWKDIDKDRIGYPFIVLCGHIHGADGEGTIKNDSDTIYYISTGSLTKNNINNTFNIYTNVKNQIFDIKYYALMDADNSEKCYWQELTDKNAVKKIQFRTSQNQVINKPDKVDTLFKDAAETNKQDLDRKIKEAKDETIKESTLFIGHKNIMSFIKDNNLFKSGHFHWKNEFRSHGFIDINHLVSHRDSLETITSLFYDAISEKFNSQFDNEILIIAIGIECNIIGARLSALFDCGYSFIPELTKLEDFSDIESTLNAGSFKKIILLKDIIFRADHSKELIEELGIQDKDVYLFSLFYCGKKENKAEIFSEFNNVSFISICDDITINECDYSGKNCLANCSINKYNLETIYEC